VAQLVELACQPDYTGLNPTQWSLFDRAVVKREAPLGDKQESHILAGRFALFSQSGI
jgi:hypothetical protein